MIIQAAIFVEVTIRRSVIASSEEEAHRRVQELALAELRAAWDIDALAFARALRGDLERNAVDAPQLTIASQVAGAEFVLLVDEHEEDNDG